MRNVLLPLMALFAAAASAQTLTRVVFQADPTAFPNPDRGLNTSSNFNYRDFSAVRAKGSSLTRPYIRLDEYRDRPLPQDFLDQLTAGFQEARRVGIKLIPRFSYNYAIGDPDATSAQIQSHLQQLAPIFAANQDVISLVEAGFIGAWGEWHHSTSASDSPAAEAEVVQALMAAVPSSRMIAIRYPADLRRLQGSGPIRKSEAFTGTLRARLGSHQDCFLASADDWGTWGLVYDAATQRWKKGLNSVTQDKAYIARNAAFAPVGGETCNVNPPRSSCRVALSELAYLHWTYLNQEFEPQVIQAFKDEGCFDEINRRLGYRFDLTEASFSPAVTAGESLKLNFRLVNRGFASMFNARPLFVVLRNAGQRFVFPLKEDPRSWSPGASKKVSVTLPLSPSVPSGAYTLSLWLPDQAISIRDNPLYAVRFANDGVWDAEAGDNVLSMNVRICEGTAPVTSSSRFRVLRAVFRIPQHDTARGCR